MRMSPEAMLSVTGLVRSSFMDRASFLGEGGPARRKQVEGVLSSGLYGVVQARAVHHLVCCSGMVPFKRTWYA